MRALITSWALVMAAACGSDCVVHPCPLPFALKVTVTSSSGSPVSGLVVVVDGGSVGCLPSDGTTCYAPGNPGTYQLDVSAPGFQSVHRTVQVGGSSGTACTCPQPTTQDVVLTLTPASPAKA